MGFSCKLYAENILVLDIEVIRYWDDEEISFEKILKVSEDV